MGDETGTKRRKIDTRKVLNNPEHDRLFEEYKEKYKENNKSKKLDLVDMSGNTFLHKAVMEENVPVVEKLLADGANVNIINNNGDTPICIAVQYENTEIIDRLLGVKGIDMDNKSIIRGDTVLHKAISKENMTIIKKLLDKGANVNIINNYGDTPLHLAVSKQNIEIIRKLLEKKGDINAQNNKGNTPLHRAVWIKNIKIVKTLLAEGANPFIYNNDKLIPYDLCNYGIECSEELKELLFDNIRTSKFNPIQETKPYTVKYEKGEKKVKLVEVLLDMHGSINDDTIYLNTNRIIFGPASYNLCFLHVLDSIPFDKIIPLNYYSKYSFIPNVSLSIDKTTNTHWKSCVQIGKYDILHKVFPTGRGTLLDLIKYLLDEQNFSVTSQFVIKDISCLGISDKISPDSDTYSYIKCYTEHDLPKGTDIHIEKVTQIKVDDTNELFFEKEESTNKFYPINDIPNLADKPLFYNNKIIPTNIQDPYSLHKKDGYVYIPNIIQKDVYLASVRNFDNVPGERRNSRDFTKKVTMPSIENHINQLIDLSKPHLNKKFFDTADKELKKIVTIRTPYKTITSYDACNLIIASKIHNNKTYDGDDTHITEIYNNLKKPNRFGNHRSRRRSRQKRSRRRRSHRRRRRRHQRSLRTLF